MAHELWIQRGSPIGSPEVDWERAEQLILLETITLEDSDVPTLVAADEPQEPPTDEPELPRRSSDGADRQDRRSRADRKTMAG